MTILEFISGNINNIKEASIKKVFPNEYIEIINFNNNFFLEHDMKWIQRLYNWINNINELPKCKNENCCNTVRFLAVGKNKRYLDYCSNKCAQSSQVIIEKKKKRKKQH